MRYYTEQIIVHRAENFYNAFPGWVGVEACIDPDNPNHRVIKVLCMHIVKIWSEWQADTRHYKPARKKYLYYQGALEKAKDLLDSEAEGYEVAKEVVRDYNEFINRVVLYRVPNGICRVM